MTAVPTAVPSAPLRAEDLPQVIFENLPHHPIHGWRAAIVRGDTIVMDRNVRKCSPKFRRQVVRALVEAEHLEVVDVEVDPAPYPMTGDAEMALVASVDLPAWDRGWRTERVGCRQHGGQGIYIYRGSSQRHVDIMLNTRVMDGDSFDADQAEELGIALLRAAATARQLEASR